MNIICRILEYRLAQFTNFRHYEIEVTYRSYFSITYDVSEINEKIDLISLVFVTIKLSKTEISYARKKQIIKFNGNNNDSVPDI